MYKLSSKRDFLMYRSFEQLHERGARDTYTTREKRERRYKIYILRSLTFSIFLALLSMLERLLVFSDFKQVHSCNAASLPTHHRLALLSFSNLFALWHICHLFSGLKPLLWNSTLIVAVREHSDIQ